MTEPFLNLLHWNPVTLRHFPADWKSYPLRAGFIRNTQMLEYAMREKPLVIAFWDGNSHGTRDMIDKAKCAGVECVVINF